jgi:hypothetical protein
MAFEIEDVYGALRRIEAERVRDERPTAPTSSPR